MKKRSVTMYNMVIPMFVVLWPPAWFFASIMGGAGGVLLLVMLVGNLAVDWLVTALALRLQKVPQIKKKSLAVLIPVWLSGFAADFLGSIPLFVLMGVDNDWIYENISGYFYTSIFESPYALAATLLDILFVGLLIYRFNRNWSLTMTDLTDQQRKRTALTLAILTAPYLFLLPTRWFYN